MAIFNISWDMLGHNPTFNSIRSLFALHFGLISLGLYVFNKQVLVGMHMQGCPFPIPQLQLQMVMCRLCLKRVRYRELFYIH
jgi:hypothetical protein